MGITWVSDAMDVLIISASLNPDSHSRVMARYVQTRLETMGVSCRLLDLQDYTLPLCDGDTAYDAPGVAELSTDVAASSVILVAVPIYNYDVNAAAKNLVELTGSAWENKTAGFLCAAGGRSSYMSVMGFANSLMLDFRCVIIPRFVYAVGDDFTESPDGQTVIGNAKVRERLDGLAIDAKRFVTFSRMA